MEGLQGHVQELTGASRGGPHARPMGLAAVRPLAVDGLVVAYGSVPALSDVTFTVGPGAVVGLLGPNGCGKTSTLRAVAGLVPAARGRVVVNGLEAGTIAARAHVGYVPDEPNGLDELCGEEYLSLVRVLHRADAAYETRAAALTRAFGVTSHLRVRLGALSHGQRRILSMVAAFALRRVLVVVDEATAALDPEAAVVLRDTLHALARGGAGVLVATQELAFAERVCDEVVLLSSGRVVARGRTVDVRAGRTLESAFLAAVGAQERLAQVQRALDAL